MYYIIRLNLNKFIWFFIDVPGDVWGCLHKYIIIYICIMYIAYGIYYIYNLFLCVIRIYKLLIRLDI